MCQSIYFGGPENLVLEVATSDVEIDQKSWVDPAVLEKVGISADEAEQYMNPDEYDGEGGSVKQPPYDPDKPHQAYPKEMYMQMLQVPDEVIWQTASYAETPVKA